MAQYMYIACEGEGGGGAMEHNAISYLHETSFYIASILLDDLSHTMHQIYQRSSEIEH